MGVWTGIAEGLYHATTMEALLFCMIGVSLGTLIGVLPGIGPTATIAILLPITTTLSPTIALIMLAGIYYGAQYGGSITAILVNTPGEVSSAITSIDGYEMAKQGRAGAALSISAIGSFFAGTIGTLVLAVAAPQLSLIALEFGAAEYFSLALLGLILAVALSSGSFLAGAGMVLIGLLVGLVGTDVYTSFQRFTLGLNELRDGIDFVALSVGIFGLTEIIRNMAGENQNANRQFAVGRLMPTRDDMARSLGPILRGTGLGSVLGVLPGGGAFLSAFASYAVEKRISRTPENFGRGAIEGVAGPESANNAGAQTSFIPMLTLGIPSNAVMALMIGGLIVQGIVPGPQIITSQPSLFWGLVVSMWIGNLMLLVINLPLVGLWVSLVRIPYWALFPAIITFACIGTFSARGSSFDLYVLAAAGGVGFLLTRFGAQPAPLLLGFVLGPMIEENFRRAMMLSDGDPTVFLQRPLSAGLIFLAIAVIGAILLPTLRRKRERIFLEEDD